jgi:hypothetical protein
LQSGEQSIIRGGIAVRIGEADGKFYIGLGPANGKAPHDSLTDAKIKALELIDTGEAAPTSKSGAIRNLPACASTPQKGCPTAKSH